VEIKPGLGCGIWFGARTELQRISHERDLGFQVVFVAGHHPDLVRPIEVHRELVNGGCGFVTARELGRHHGVERQTRTLDHSRHAR